MSTAEIAELLRRFQFAYPDEARLQEGIASALAANGVDALREVRLARGRVDLLAGRVGIEVKVAGTAATLREQIAGYLEDPRLDGLVVVTSRVSHLAVRQEQPKPVEVVALAWAGL